MWCATECWDCEDKTCEQYFSKKDIYFKYKQLQSNWNSLREWLKNREVWDISIVAETLDKMNELEGKDKE